jgi:hypothetical protein
MKVTAIMSTYHGYYYQRNETTLTTRTSKTVKEKKFLETTETTYQTPITINSTEYAKNAYQISFKPHELICNLHEV